MMLMGWRITTDSESLCCLSLSLFKEMYLNGYLHEIKQIWGR